MTFPELISVSFWKLKDSSYEDQESTHLPTYLSNLRDWLLMATIRQKPQNVDNYNWEQHGQTSSNKFGVQLFKPGVNAEARKPSYKGTLTVFRPFPALRQDDPNGDFAPYRIDPEGHSHFGDWIRRYDCAWGVGNSPQTFLLHDPSACSLPPDKYHSPLGVLYRAVEEACKKGHPRLSEWQPLREGGVGRGKKLTAPTEVYLMQGIIMVIDSKPQFGQGKVPIGWGPKSPTCVLMVSKSLGQHILDLCNQEAPNYRGDKRNFEARYLNGDVVSPDTGRYIYIYQKGHDPREKFNPSASTQSGPVDLDATFDPNVVRSGGGRGQEFGEAAGYDAYMDKTYNNISAALSKEPQRDMIRSKWLFWRDALWFPTYQEQAKILWAQFPKSACVYAWKTHNPTWISPEMWAEFKGAAQQIVTPPGETVEPVSDPLAADSDPFATDDFVPAGTDNLSDVTDNLDLDPTAPEPLPDVPGLPSAAADPFAAGGAQAPSGPPAGDKKAADDAMARYRARTQSQQTVQG